MAGQVRLLPHLANKVLLQLPRMGGSVAKSCHLQSMLRYIPWLVFVGRREPWSLVSIPLEDDPAGRTVIKISEEAGKGVNSIRIFEMVSSGCNSFERPAPLCTRNEKGRAESRGTKITVLYSSAAREVLHRDDNNVVVCICRDRKNTMMK